MTIVEFIRARLADDEEIARGHVRMAMLDRDSPSTFVDATHDAAKRRIADCEVLRAVVELCDATHDADLADSVLRAIAASWLAHPDYRLAWKADEA